MSNIDDDVTDARPNITHLLAAHAGGETAKVLSHALGEVVAAQENCAVDGARKSKGKLVITIGLERDDSAYRVTIEHKLTVPKVRPDRDLMFATSANGLSRENPRQRKLPFEQVTVQRQ